MSYPEIARRVTMKSRLVFFEGNATGKEISRIAGEGGFGPVQNPGINCGLEYGGQIIALGRLVKKRGKILFKVQERKEG